jgi:hypothetical protein
MQFLPNSYRATSPNVREAIIEKNGKPERRIKKRKQRTSGS